MSVSTQIYIFFYSFILFYGKHFGVCVNSRPLGSVCLTLLRTKCSIIKDNYESVILHTRQNTTSLYCIIFFVCITFPVFEIDHEPP